MNHKATLYCRAGRLFRPSTHYLLLDDWITGKTGYIILSHVIITEQEYRSIVMSGGAAIYQSMSFNWIGLYSCHSSRKFSDYQCIGVLNHLTGKLYGGMVNVK